MELGHVEPQNESWITSEEVPDPSPLPQVLTYHLLIRPLKIQDTYKTDSGIELYIPDSAKQDIQYLTNVGRVVAKGPTAFIDPDAKGTNPHGKFGDDFVGVGDYVVWSKHAGTKVKVKGVTLVLIADDQLLMKVDSPDVINPMDNLRGMASYRPA